MKTAFPVTGAGQGESCYNYILSKLKSANVGQDDGVAANALERHYNRPLDKANAQVAAYNTRFTNYMASEVNAFWKIVHKADPTCDECDMALDALGRVTHTWQDYYAHAVLTGNGKPSPAWSARPPVTGDPDNLNPALKPSSWGGITKPGEHGWGEPGNAAGEQGPRQNAAVSFVAGKLKKMLPQWYARCRCCCTEPGK